MSELGSVILLAQRLKTVNEKVLRLQGSYEEQLKQREAFREEIQKLKADNVVLSQASEVLKKLLDDLIVENVHEIEDLVTKGLKAVFQDQDLAFKALPGEWGGKLSIDLQTAERQVSGDMESFGGSVSAIESFLLRILVMRKLGLAPYLFLDESFAPVGTSYVDNTAKLCKLLAQQFGINIFLITHQEQFLEHADIGYRVEAVVHNDLKVSRLKKIRG